MQQRQREQGAGDTPAHNGDLTRGAGATGKPGGLRRDRQILFHHPDQHVAFAAKAFGFPHGKPRLLQPTTDKARRGEGGKRCARARQTCHGAEQVRAPHVRVFGGRKTVQEPGVHLLIH